MTSVFISHSALDHELVGTLIVSLLEQHGLSVWYSRDSIHAAEEWEKRIRQALMASDWFLVALSANSVQSEWVRAEVDWALENRRGKLVPVLIGDCDPQECHLRLRQIQYLDLRRGNPEGRAELLRVWNLGPVQSSPSTDPITPSVASGAGVGGRKARPISRVAGATLVLALAIGAAVYFHGRTAPANRGLLGPSVTTAKAEPGVESPPVGLPAVVKAPEIPPLLVEVGLGNPKVDAPPEEISPEFKVSYHYQRDDGKLIVGYHLPYLETQRAGKTTLGIENFGSPFRVQAPVLSVKLHNSSAQSLMVTECLLRVTASRVDREPVIVVADKYSNGLYFRNEGWGDVVNPLLSFKILPLPGPAAANGGAVERHTLELASFGEMCEVPLTKYVPKELANASAATVAGELEMGPPGQRKKVPFTTTMVFEIRAGMAVPPSYVYDLALTAGKAPDTVLVPVSHNLKPGESDQFELRVASDKSAHYEFRFAVRLIDGREFAGQNVVLDTFLPRSQTEQMEKAPPPAPGVPAPQ